MVTCGKPREIKPSLREFEALLAHEEKVNAKRWGGVTARAADGDTAPYQK